MTRTTFRIKPRANGTFELFRVSNDGKARLIRPFNTTKGAKAYARQFLAGENGIASFEVSP